MYFPIGWPKVLHTPELGSTSILQVICNRDRILLAILTDDSLAIWFCKPCVPIVIHRRTQQSLKNLGENLIVEWKPDSSMLVIVTTQGHLVYYNLSVVTDQRGLYLQTDSPHLSLRRDSAELFIKEVIPPLHLSSGNEVMVFDGNITSIVCITMTELMVATTKSHVLRYKWDGTQHRDYNLDLRRVPFCINQQVSKAVPIIEDNIFITNIEYSPLVGGFAITLNDGRAAFLTASSLKFDPNQVQGIWAQGIEDATCSSVNHKYRLITYGRKNSECVVYYVDESTGGLEVSHNCQLGSKDYPGCPGAVSQIRWTPDGCAMAASWAQGGVGLWSTFGALLMCTLGWDYGLHVDLNRCSPLLVLNMEWSTEGYQLWMIRKETKSNSTTNEDCLNSNNETIPATIDSNFQTSVIQLDFVKSALTVNPCMSHQSNLYLQGDDRLYLNTADSLIKVFSNNSNNKNDGVFNDTNAPLIINDSLAEGRQWVVVPIPSTYSATNWPIRYSAIDQDGQNFAVAGRTGLAHYSFPTRRWKLFGNETQEKDFIVTGGMLWWRDYIIMGTYSIVDNSDQLRLYPKETKLDNKFAKIFHVTSPVLLINVLYDQLIVFYSDAQVAVYSLTRWDGTGNIDITKIQAIDISALCVHPACVVSVTLTSLRTEKMKSESIVLNVSGRLLMVQREAKGGAESKSNGWEPCDRYTCSMPTVLASCVENVWVPATRKPDKANLTEALWLFCGAHGMRVWLPLFPKDGDKSHSFMSKRIMLPFHLRIYPLAILFEDAIILGAENDTVLYTSDSTSPFSLPFNVLERTSQVYLHQILRQLIRRNLGYHAWEIAWSCANLPYFPHSLELLLHEVLEEEATSKEPIPDAQLPSVIEFISEFPVYLQTVVQCARKTEIALWPYLFSAAGKPKDLFQKCMASNQLDTAASYLIILQNLETSFISRQYATLLLDTALDETKWELAKDLVRFLRAIDPNDVESPRNSFILPNKLGLSQQTTPVSPNDEDLSLILGSVQGPRGRSYSTTVNPKIPSEAPVRSIPISITNNNDSPGPNKRKKSVPSPIIRQDSKDNSGTAEEFFIDVILQRHARKLLTSHRMMDLGFFAAHLDFHLVTWLAKERDRAARIDDFVTALKQLHDDFDWPYPAAQNVPRKSSPASVHSLPESPSLINLCEERIHNLHIESGASGSSRVGDSGYMSLPGVGLITPLLSDDYQSSQIGVHEAQLSPDVRDRRSVPSSSTSSWCGYSSVLPDIGTGNWRDMPSSQVLEQLSQAVNKGSQRSEVQLRYLLQLFMEASCLEWSLLISVLLRDAMAVLRTINAARLSDQPPEAVLHLKQGFQLLYYWTNTECLGYQSFMQAIQSHISVLATILAAKFEQQQIIQQQQKQLQLQQTPSSQNNMASSMHHHHHHHHHPVVTRSRKSSSNHDSNSVTGSSREKVGSVSSSLATSDRMKETNLNLSSGTDNLERNDQLAMKERDVIAENNSGCVLS